MNFTGTVQFRSSVNPQSGPPGEAEILSLNPNRRERILNATGWEQLEPGTLNLNVENGVLDALMQYEPLISEVASDIKYPVGYQHIPQKRKKYFYFKGQLNTNGEMQEVLIRRALIPVRNRIELFAPVNLKEKFNLFDNDTVSVTVTS